MVTGFDIVFLIFAVHKQTISPLLIGNCIFNSKLVEKMWEGEENSFEIDKTIYFCIFAIVGINIRFCI